MTTTKLKKIALLRLEEARFLLANKNYSGAYYLVGYSVELALKACISKKMQRHTIPDKKFILDCYTHDLKALVRLAGLENDRIAREKDGTPFAENWGVVKDWSESARYEVFTRKKAEELILSVDSNPGGVLAWIQQHW